MKSPIQDIENKPTFWMKAGTSEGQPPELVVKCAIVEEALSELTRMRIEFLCRDRSLNLRGLLGQPMTLCYAEKDRDPRYFQGLCVEVECIGQHQGMARFVAEVRPPVWFLTRRHDCRIYQGDKTPAIIQKVLQEDGFSADLKLNLSSSYGTREFCVQYRETDFDFISRLMEEDGIYYYFTHDDRAAAMVLADGPGQHKPIPGGKLEFVESEVVEFDHGGQVFEWTAQGRATSGKVSLVSYDFERPGSGLQVSRGMSHGKHPMAQAERYDNHGRYVEASQGEHWAKVGMEAEHHPAQVWTGLSNAYRLSPGHTFTLTGGPRSGEPNEFLITRATHYIQRDEDARQTVVGVHAVEHALDLGRHAVRPYRCRFEAIPKSVQFRPARVTPWPNVGGVHTAVVTGPAGEEIHTDKYGRVKIQFHWDRDGKKDDKSSIWVRTMMPWTGKTWGTIAVPRVGNEVVVQFEEGDPDRPIVIGMVYNGTNMPPYALPENKTVSGVKTNSSKGGDGYNELIFEDKKGSELVRFHAEKDYLQVVENNARISVGREKKAGGDLSQRIHRNRTAFTGLFDSENVGGMKSTAIGGANAELVLGVKSTAVGYHVYETVGMPFSLDQLMDDDWLEQVVDAGINVAMGGGGNGSGEGDGAIDGLEGFGLVAALKAAWSVTSEYPAFALMAETLAAGIYKGKGLKPGRTTFVYGDVKTEVSRAVVGDAKGDHTTVINDGDMTIEVKLGKLTTLVHQDVQQTVSKGQHCLKVETGPQIVIVEKGDRKIGVATGKLETKVDKGDYSLEVALGNIDVQACLGSIKLEAMQTITLKVGTSKIEISQMGINIEGTMINVKSTAMTEVNGGAMSIVKGAFVMIN